SSRPIILLATGLADREARVIKINDDANTVEDTQTSQKPMTDGVIYRHDGIDQDAEVAYFCNGSGEDVLRQRIKDGTYSSASHTAKADHLGVVGADLWRSEGYLVSKLTLNTDPGIDTNWAVTKIPVGRPLYPVNKILDLGGSPLCLTGEGVFRYNPAPRSARFDNLTPFITPHPDNGKGGFMDGRGRVYYPTETEGILVLTFGSQSQQRPLRFNFVDRDTPSGRIGAMTADDEHIYAAVNPGSIRTEQLSLYVQKVVDEGGGGEAWTNYTTEATDLKYTTTIDLTDLDNVNNDYLYIGATEPFWDLFLEVLDKHGGTARAWSMEFSAGSGSWTATTEYDSTYSGVRRGTVSFGLGGIIGDIVADGSWQKDTVNSITDRYWVRLSANGTMTGTGTIWRVSIAPYRPPIDKDLFPQTGPALAGALPHILVGSWRGETLVWHQVWTLQSPQIEQLLIGRTTGRNSFGRQTLWAITDTGFFHMPIGPSAHPSR
ncbi:hypothetical protein LCGC14_2523750, partial [marine sediment metagenome]